MSLDEFLIPNGELFEGPSFWFVVLLWNVVVVSWVGLVVILCEVWREV